MKILTLILSLVISSVALAQEPAELERLRHLWEQSVAKEIDEKNKIYLKSLEKLQKKFMEAKNLAAAVAVDNEIKMVRVLKPEQQRKSPLEGEWMLKDDGKRVLYAFKGNKLVCTDRGITKWTLRNGVVEVIWSNHDWWWKLKVEPDRLDILTGVSKSGNEFILERVKW
jgi:hypothetical protein